MNTPHIRSVDTHAFANDVKPSAKPKNTEGGFGSVLAEQLLNVNEQQVQADSAVTALATGETDDVNFVVMQMAEADLTFRMAIEIRNRLIESYQEIMRLQV